MTPAPWRYEPAATARTWGRIVAADGTEVAITVGAANGELLAAAAEMFEVLTDLLNCAAFGAIPKHVWDRATEVHAKAEGRTT